MRLPFTHEQFLDLFGTYNAALWPLVVLLWLASVAAVAGLWQNKLTPKQAGLLLALLWACSAGYHLVLFTRINPAAWLFGAVFIIQVVLLLVCTFRGPGLAVSWGRRPHQVLSIVFSVYAVLYPFIGLATGLAWPRMPSFGVPCPTTLLTVGFLLGLAPGKQRFLGIIPVLWCIVGGSASIALAIRPDFMLLVGAVLLALYLIAPRTLGGRAAEAQASRAA